MNYSRRQLYALGEPIGESATRLKLGGRIYGGGGGGGGGGSSNQTSTSTNTSELPEWARGYAKDTLAKGAALTDINQNPYQTYGANRIAGFSPMQQQSFQGAANMQSPEQMGTATDLAKAAGMGAIGTQYRAGQFNGGQFGQDSADQYMSPYMQSVVQNQQRDAQRQADIATTQRSGQATQAGAFGGSRQAIGDAEAARNLALQKGDIQAQGLQSSYTNAQQQFNADQARRMQAQQLREQSRQYGAGLGMQGLQTGLQAAGQLGQLGGQQFQQRMDINKLQSAYGGQMQQQAQRPLDQAYQDFQNQQNYPYKQLGFMSDMIRGLPLGQQSTSSMYQGSGNTIGQLAGLGMGAYGVSQLMRAEGGTVHDYAEGGVTSDQNVEGMLSKLSDQQLQQAKQGALARRDVEQANMIDAEMSMRASARSGISAAITPDFADQMEESMASGGIVAFADKGAVKEIPEKATSSIGDILNTIGVNDAVNSLRESYYKTKEGVQRMERAEDVLPGIFESMTPSERAKRKAAGTELFKGPKDVAQMTPAEIEAAKAITMGSTVKPSKSSNSLTAAEIEARNAAIMGGKNVDKAGNVVAQKTEGLSSGPKPSKAEVKSAVAQFAEQRGLSSNEKEDYMATALKIREELGKQNQPILDKLNAAIEGQKPNEQALKDRGIGQALAQFGFGMAERASKPGARFLESAAGASPILASVAEKTNTLIDTQKQNYTNLRLDQAKYEVALAKGDMSTAATLAGQIRQANQQDQMLKFQIAKAQDDLQMEKAKLAQTGAYYSAAANRIPETVTGLAKELMKDPAFKGTPNDAIAQAANMLKGGIPAGIRSETALAEARAKAIEKVDGSTIGKLFALTNESDPKYAERKTKYNQQVQQQMNQLISPGALPSIGNTPPSGSGSNPIRFNAQGNPI